MVDDKLACFFIAGRTQHRQNRTENLVAIDRHVGGDTVQQRATDKIAILIALKFQPAAIDNNLGAILFTLIDIAFNTGLGFGRNDRAHFNARFVILADLQRPHLWRQLADKPVGRVIANRQHRGNRHAAFASRSVGRAHGRINRLIHIGIRHDDHVVLGTAQRLNTLAVGTAARIDIFADRGRADKADRRHIKVIEKRIDSFLIAMNNIETAIWQAGF